MSRFRRLDIRWWRRKLLQTYVAWKALQGETQSTKWGLTVIEAKALRLDEGVYDTSGKQRRERVWDDGVVQVNIAQGMMHKEGTSLGKWSEIE